MAAIKKLLRILGSEAESWRRDSPAPFQTTRNTDNLDAPTHSLHYLAENAKNLQDALERGFTVQRA